jgi:hypothetical protein
MLPAKPTRQSLRQFKSDSMMTEECHPSRGKDLRLFKAAKHFASLADCMDFLGTMYPPEMLTMRCRDPYSDRIHEKALPRYYFRGEDAAYETTTSARSRLQQSSALSSLEKDEILSVTKSCEVELSKLFKVPSLLAKGYCQHYGLPTELIDFTSDIQIAAVFASLGDVAVNSTGLVAVLDHSGLNCLCPETPCRWTCADLTEHPYAERAVRQSAMGFSHLDHSDLKKDCTSSFDLRWFSFQRKESDIAKFNQRLSGPESVLDAKHDRVAGYLPLEIDAYVDSHRPLSERAAKWLASRVSPARVHGIVDRRSDGTKYLRAITGDEAKDTLDETAERHRNFMNWSGAGIP